MTWLTDPRNNHLGGVVRIRSGLGTGTGSLPTKVAMLPSVHLPNGSRPEEYLLVHAYVAEEGAEETWWCPVCISPFEEPHQLLGHWEEIHR